MNDDRYGERGDGDQNPDDAYHQNVFLTVFIIVKITTIISMMMLGMRSHYIKSNRVN